MSVYFQGTDFISNTDEVIRLARNVVNADFNQQQVESYQYKEYSVIRTFSNKDDWEESDREYGAMQLIETRLAACDVMEHYGKSEAQMSAAYQLRKETMEMLNNTIDNSDTSTGEESEEIQVTARRSWNLNENVDVPRGNLTII
jgi:hypothetical protein